MIGLPPVRDRTGSPRWFVDALARRPEHSDIDVAGARVHFRAWGARGAPGLVLVHGGGANSAWWDHIAPFFAADHRVVALDLSGHGDSGHRDAYGLARWADEVAAVAAAGGMSGGPVVVGHSLGGWVTATVAANYDVAGVVVVDSRVDHQPADEQPVRASAREVRHYPHKETILGRFRTMPEQEVLLPYVVRHIAEESVRLEQDGWTWKFDRRIFAARALLGELLASLTCRVGFLRCEFGVVPDQTVAELEVLLGGRGLILDLPAAGHHPMLDQPLALVTALRAVLGHWVLPRC